MDSLGRADICTDSAAGTFVVIYERMIIIYSDRSVWTFLFTNSAADTAVLAA